MAEKFARIAKLPRFLCGTTADEEAAGLFIGGDEVSGESGTNIAKELDEGEGLKMKAFWRVRRIGTGGESVRWVEALGDLNALGVSGDVTTPMRGAISGSLKIWLKCECG